MVEHQNTSMAASEVEANNLVEVVPPPGFVFNPDSMSDYDEQVKFAAERYDYQQQPLPSFENVPHLDITPKFNPTGVRDEEIYAQGRVPKLLRPHIVPRSEWSDDPSPVPMWRILERHSLEDGTGLVSSAILKYGTLGDVEGFDPVKHYASNHKRRVDGENSTTPFVSFSTDPVNLAEQVILRHGFGIKEGRDSVVVQINVDPSRVLGPKQNKSEEVILLGGVAPSEYVAAYSVEDFIGNLVSEDREVNTISGMMKRDQALGHWALHD